MRYNVYYDDNGTILSMIGVETEPSVPRDGMRLLSTCNRCELELTGELTALSPIEIHTRYRVERTTAGAELVPHRFVAAAER